MGSKKNGNVLFFCTVGLFFFYNRSVGHKKHGPTELFTPFEALYKTCL